MRSLFGCLLSLLAFAAVSTTATAQLAVPTIGGTAGSNLEKLVTVRTAYLDVTDRSMIVNAMIFNAAGRKARNIVVQCEFRVSHHERHAVQRLVKDQPIPPHYGLQFAIDYGRPFSAPPYATTCGVVKAELD